MLHSEQYRRLLYKQWCLNEYKTLGENDERNNAETIQALFLVIIHPFVLNYSSMRSVSTNYYGCSSVFMNCVPIKIMKLMSNQGLLCSEC